MEGSWTQRSSRNRWYAINKSTAAFLILEFPFPKCQKPSYEGLRQLFFLNAIDSVLLSHFMVPGCANTCSSDWASRFCTWSNSLRYSIFYWTLNIFLRIYPWFQNKLRVYNKFKYISTLRAILASPCVLFYTLFKYEKQSKNVISIDYPHVRLQTYSACCWLDAWRNGHCWIPQR